MSDEGLTQTPAVFSSKERAALVARALSEAARRARFSTKRRRAMNAGSLRARRSERILRLAKIISFILVVAIPGLLYGSYMGFIASPQYVTETRFTVRGGMPPSEASLGDMAGAPTMLIVQDTQVIMNYIESRAMVEDLERTVGFKGLYDNSFIDYFSRLKPSASIEKTLLYWKHHITLKVQMPAGIVEFDVRAFTPDDAVKVADAALKSSEAVVNTMNDKMRQDALTLAETERQRAETALAQARANLEKARNSEGILSTDVATTALQGLLQQVQSQLIKMQQDYDAQRRYVRADAPQLRNLQTKIDAAKREITKLQARMTTITPTGKDKAADTTPKDDGLGGKVLSGSMSRLEYATLENTIREKIYAGSLVALEQAKLASETKLMYINTFVQPVAPQDSRYPNRPQKIAVFLVIALALWGIVVMLLTLAKSNLT